MGRKAEQNKLTAGSNGLLLEQNTVYDDNLLPAAEELARLNAIDPEIVPWVMRRTEIEQDGRIWYNKKRAKLVGREINFSGLCTIMGLILTAALIAGVFYLSYDLIKNGHEATGGIFGGIDLVALIGLLAKFKMRNEKQ